MDKWEFYSRHTKAWLYEETWFNPTRIPPSGSLAAAGIIAILPAIILSLTTQKYIVKGMMNGAVKV